MRPLQNCSCCGQPVQSDTLQTVRVDDALLGFCNDAYGRAARRGVSEVGIADVAWCIAGSSRWVREIELAGGSVGSLLAGAEAMLAAAERRGASGASRAPRTSNELKKLLARAESIADQLGRACATPGDFIHVLLLDSDDLGSAAFVRSSFGKEAAVRSDPRPAGGGFRADARGGGWSREEREIARGYAAKWRQEAPVGARQSFAAAPDVVQPRLRPEPHEIDSRTRVTSHTASAAIDVGPEAVAGRLAAYETQLTALQRQAGGLAEQIVMLTATIERLAERDPGGVVRQIEAELGARDVAHRRESAGLASRLDAHERHLTELRRQILALSHESETLAARLALALDLGRTQASALARMEQTVGTTMAMGDTGDSRRGRRFRTSRKAARSRLRQIRRRHLRFRLRQRRRDRLRLRLRSDGRQMMWPQSAMSVPVASIRETLSDDRADPPKPTGLSSPMPNLSTVEPVGEFEEEIAEPIEDEDDLEPVGAFGERPKRFYLALGDAVERAPSIGPRTAERLTAAGIVTVRDLLMCDARDVASRIASRYVSVDRVTAWKAQSRLVCTIPWLRGTHAQLLVGAGFESLESLVDADASSVCAGILRFAATREGQSVLRSAPPPAAERVMKWMEHVNLAEPERVKLAA